jgi:hypothetical protein
MASRFPAPTEQAIDAILDGLVTVRHQVNRAPAADPERDTTGVFAEFVTESGELGVLAFADHNVVNFVGGAISSVDVVELQEAGSKAVVDDDAFEGFREFANAFPSCLNSEFTPALHLSQSQRFPYEVSNAVKALWTKPAGRRSFRIGVNDFGEGAVILYFG